MIAGPDSTTNTMRRALSYSIGALAAAISADIDRSDEDRIFFEAEKAKLQPLAIQLRDVDIALDDFDLGPGEVHQAQVEIGDDVLDRGIRAANTRTKLGLRDKAGLDASHAFGTRVDTLTDTPLASEPAAVFEAVKRLDDLPSFDGRDAIKADLTTRATQQEKFLKQRDVGDGTRVQLESQAVRLVTESALALASLKGALDQRFPRQRKYVASFFLDVGRKRRRKSSDDEK